MMACAEERYLPSSTAQRAGAVLGDIGLDAVAVGVCSPPAGLCSPPAVPGCGAPRRVPAPPPRVQRKSPTSHGAGSSLLPARRSAAAVPPAALSPPRQGRSRKGLLHSPPPGPSRAIQPAVVTGTGTSSTLARLLAEQQAELRAGGGSPQAGRSPPRRAPAQAPPRIDSWSTGGAALPRRSGLQWGEAAVEAASAALAARKHRAQQPPQHSPQRHHHHDERRRLAPRPKTELSEPWNVATARMDGVGLSDPVMDGLGLESPRYAGSASPGARESARPGAQDAPGGAPGVAMRRKLRQDSDRPHPQRDRAPWPQQHLLQQAFALMQPQMQPPQQQRPPLPAQDEARVDELYYEAIARRGLSTAEVERAWTDGKLLAGGEGGFGEVRGCRLSCGTDAAVKRFRCPRQQQRRELALLWHCRHRCVLPLVGACVAKDGGLLVVTDLVKGGNLERLLLRPLHRSPHLGNLQRGRRWSALADAACGLAHMHGLGAVHCDVKPANILVGDPSVLADFGLAAFVPPGASGVSEAGFSEDYRAPEVAETGEVTYAGDVFALGVGLLQALIGAGARDRSVAARHVTEQTDELLLAAGQQQGWTHRQMEFLLREGRRCCTTSSHRRPTAASIAAALRGSDAF
eukprot:TRINITY_DN60256_c0_g1_i1.p1 TRINITY_DN60256_c0_g1~~TRINITY_DN60256_c0_g1_i1.p1  ORF type:complete len:631 (+),score=174.68 TRINITY_DN60256_c0_g1_i1:84-1976(+)